MVNKQNQGAGANRPLFFVLFFFFLFQGFFSQNISRHYITDFQQAGIMYFIYEREGFFGTTNKSRFSYDISYINSKDSATINFTYQEKNGRNLDSIAFIRGGRRVASPLKKIYVDLKGSKWIYRYSATLTFSDLKAFFEVRPEQPLIQLYTREGTVDLAIKQKTWTKTTRILSKIFLLISFNQKK